MNEWKEYTAKTTNEALTNALIDLETTSDRVEYEVIEKEKSGFLGIGSKLAKIKVRVKQVIEEPDKKDEVKEEVQVEAVQQEVKEEQVDKKQENVYQKDKKEDNHSFNEKKMAPAKVLTEEEAEKVIDVVKDFMTKLFAAMHMEVAYEVDYNFDTNSLNIDLSGEEMGILIGKRGQTLDSLQYLISLVANRANGSYVKVKLDTENYRQRRKDTLENLAVNISHKVKRTRRSVILEPMNPYERRIIHSALQHDRYVETHSEGEEPYRKVVVTLKKEYYDYNGGRSNSHGRYSGGSNRNYNRNRYNNRNSSHEDSEKIDNE